MREILALHQLWRRKGRGRRLAKPLFLGQYLQGFGIFSRHSSTQMLTNTSAKNVQSILKHFQVTLQQIISLYQPDSLKSLLTSPITICCCCCYYSSPGCFPLYHICCCLVSAFNMPHACISNPIYFCSILTIDAPLPSQRCRRAD